MSKTIRLAVNAKTGRPGCVLIQAAFKCDSSFVSSRVKAEHWQIEWSDMAPFELPEEKVDGYLRFIDTQAKKGWPVVQP